MFRNRRNTQKPNNEFIQSFQKTFSDIVPSTSQHNASGEQEPTELVDRTRSTMSGNDMKTNGQFAQPTPNLQLSSPFFDPGSLSFLPYANQPNNLVTPNSGVLDTGFHSQHAGDLHTPTMGLGVMNPLSLPQQFPMEADPAMGLNQLGQQFFSQPFQNAQPFAQQQQQSFAPSAFVHRDSGYDAMGESAENSSLHDLDLQVDPPSKMPASTVEFQEQVNDRQSLVDQKFQYNTTLRAPTAMIKNSRDIPISYLNKGQAYSLSVHDSNPPPMGAKLAQYRTYVRVSFQEEEQRAKPAACWQLWKEGRGSSESHQRGGKLQAVEYVDPLQGGDGDRKPRQIQVESTSFDGFCVTWTANPATGVPDCTIPVRFNFLSTDFSHSKGVKGIPVRLCTKTQLISDVENPMDRDAEVCYCQVKLFRDHGAERKLSNDVAHVKKTIEKLKQQIAQAEMGAGSNGKRKRASASVAFNGPDNRPSKITKHRRTWSMDSQETPERMSLEDDLHSKLAMMQEMFTSTRPVSSLNLQGDEQDDPDLFPVKLPDPTRKPGLQTLHRPQSTPDAAMSSPTNSTLSTNSPHTWNQSPANLQSDSGYHGSLDSSRSNSLPTSERSISHPVKVQRVSWDPNVSTGFIEALDMDPNYRPPVERLPKPIACFYLRFPSSETQKDDFYRAVYLSERSVHDLLEKISLKRCIDPKRIVRVLHIKQDGLKIMVDDDVVRELPDGQDMDVEVSEADGSDDSKESTVELKLSY